jgi:hypothetical protein
MQRGGDTEAFGATYITGWFFRNPTAVITGM